MAMPTGGNVTTGTQEMSTVYTNTDSNTSNDSYTNQSSGFRDLKVYGKVIKEVQYSNLPGVNQISAFKLEDGTVLSAQEVATAYQMNKTDGIQVVTGSTTESLVIKSVRGYSATPLSQLPRFY